MTSVTRIGSIPSPVEAVWEVLADFGDIVTWAPNVDHSCLLTEQTTGVGTARRVQAGRTTLVETVTHWTPPVADTPGQLTYTLSGLPKLFRSATNSWWLCADGDGTHVELTSTVDTGPRPPQRAIAGVLARVVARASDTMIAGLTAHVSAGRSAGPPAEESP